jgi:hypothetical protein
MRVRVLATNEIDGVRILMNSAAVGFVDGVWILGFGEVLVGG